MRRVLVTPPLLRTGEWPYRAPLEQAGLEIVYPDPGVDVFNAKQLVGALEGISAVVAGVEPYDAEVLAQSKLRVVARVGVGYDAIDVPAATCGGTAVTITPGTNENSVAEQTIALIFGVYRGVALRDRQTRAGHWIREQLPRLAGRTIGLVGLGRIGKAVAWRAQGLGLEVISHDPFTPPSAAAELGIRMVSLDELFTTADIVSLHCPSSPQTHHLIRASNLAKMKPTAVLVNTARGSLVDEADLAAALKAGKLWGAGLDVFEVEPPAADNPLLHLDQVVLAPHVAGVDVESIRAMSTMAAECVAKLSVGVWPEGCVVNDSLRDGWKW